MRVAGALVLTATFMVSAFIGLFPTSVSFLGTSVSCGPPLTGVFIEESEDGDFGLADQCTSQSVIRLGVAGVLFLVGATAGGLMVALGGGQEHRPQQAYRPVPISPDGRYWWDGTQWRPFQ